MKKGFSLIELLAVIALLGVMLTLASIAITTYKKNSEENLKNQKIKYIETGALRWGEENLNSIPSSGVVKQVQVFIDAGYITGDDDTQANLTIPGTNDIFNNKYVCIKYENIFSDKNLSSYSSYHGQTNYQVTAKYKGTTNSCN